MRERVLLTVERGRPTSARATPRTSSVLRLPRRGKKAWWEKGVQAFQDAPPLWDPFDQDPKLVLNTAESHARDQELGLWRNQAVLAHARAQSAWRALDAEYGGMRERLDVGPQPPAADYLGLDRARGVGLQRPRTANPAGRAPPPSSYLGVGAEVLGRGVSFGDDLRGSIGTFRDGAVAGYRDHDAIPWQRPRPKSAGVRDQRLPYGGLSRVTEAQEFDGGSTIKRAAVYGSSPSSSREALGRGALAGDVSSRSRPISANIRLSGGGPSLKGGSVQGGGSEFDLSTCDEDTESVVSFIKDDVSEAEFSTGAEFSPQKNPSPHSNGEGERVRYFPPEGGESGAQDGGARMQAKLVKLQRLCAEKDSLIRDLEAEVRRLDSALGEETTLR
jgi:hypothetical protein